MCTKTNPLSIGRPKYKNLKLRGKRKKKNKKGDIYSFAGKKYSLVLYKECSIYPHGNSLYKTRDIHVTAWSDER